MENVTDWVVVAGIAILLMVGLSQLEDVPPDWQEGTVVEVYTKHHPARRKCVAGRIGCFWYTTQPYDEHHAIVHLRFHTRREFPNGYTESKWTRDTDVRLAQKVFETLRPGQEVRLRTHAYPIVTSRDIAIAEEK